MSHQDGGEERGDYTRTLTLSDQVTRPDISVTNKPFHNRIFTRIESNKKS